MNPVTGLAGRALNIGSRLQGLAGRASLGGARTLASGVGSGIQL